MPLDPVVVGERARREEPLAALVVQGSECPRREGRHLGPRDRLHRVRGGRPDVPRLGGPVERHDPQELGRRAGRRVDGAPVVRRLVGGEEPEDHRDAPPLRVDGPQRLNVDGPGVARRLRRRRHCADGAIGLVRRLVDARDERDQGVGPRAPASAPLVVSNAEVEPRWEHARARRSGPTHTRGPGHRRRRHVGRRARRVHARPRTGIGRDGHDGPRLGGQRRRWCGRLAAHADHNRQHGRQRTSAHRATVRA